MQDTDGSHYFGAAPAVQIEKFTNLQDADVPPGPQIAVGGPVTWSYRVTNTGNVVLSHWQVTDTDASTSILCPRIVLIAPGQTIVCFSRGTATAGQYANTGTVTAHGPSGAGHATPTRRTTSACRATSTSRS